MVLKRIKKGNSKWGDKKEGVYFLNLFPFLLDHPDIPDFDLQRWLSYPQVLLSWRGY